MKSASPSDREENTMFPDLPIPFNPAIPGLVTSRALPSGFPIAPGGKESLDKDTFCSFLEKLNDVELRLLRDQLRRVEARIFAARTIYTLFAQFSRDALQELADSLD